MPKPRVFISSTFYDLVQLREDIARFITDMGYEPVRHEAGDVAYGSRRALTTMPTEPLSPATF